METPPLYSAEITELIGTPPRWLTRAGGGLLLLALLVAFTLAAVVRVPDNRVLPLVIRGSVVPYYVVPTVGTNWQRQVQPGQVVNQGQELAASRADTVRMRAPFAGVFFAAGPVRASGTTSDTVGILVPLATAYRFSGQVAAEQVAELRRMPELRIEVPLAGPSGSLHLRGKLGYLNPAVRAGQVSYVGYLDSLSGVALAQQLVPSARLDGRLLLSRRHPSVLQRLWQRTTGD